MYWGNFPLRPVLGQRERCTVPATLVVHCVPLLRFRDDEALRRMLEHAVAVRERAGVAVEPVQCTGRRLERLDRKTLTLAELEAMKAAYDALQPTITEAA